MTSCLQRFLLFHILRWKKVWSIRKSWENRPIRLYALNDLVLSPCWPSVSLQLDFVPIGCHICKRFRKIERGNLVKIHSLASKNRLSFFLAEGFASKTKPYFRNELAEGEEGLWEQPTDKTWLFAWGSSKNVESFGTRGWQIKSCFTRDYSTAELSPLSNKMCMCFLINFCLSSLSQSFICIALQ